MVVAIHSLSFRGISVNQGITGVKRNIFILRLAFSRNVRNHLLGFRPLLQNRERKRAKLPKKKYVIVRTFSAGVFAGNLVSREGKEVVLEDARRLWYWAGAASLSQLAVDGTSNPKGCKFPVAVPRIELTEAIEVLDVTEKAQASIAGVPVWSA